MKGYTTLAILALISINQTFGQSTCFQQDTLFLEESQYTGLTIDACQQSCKDDPDCQFFTFSSTGGRCGLRYYFPNGIVNSTGQTSGTKCTTLSANQVYVGKTEPLNSPEECQVACQQDPKCQSMTFNDDTSRNPNICVLNYGPTDITPTIQSGSGIVSAPKFCDLFGAVQATINGVNGLTETIDSLLNLASINVSFPICTKTADLSVAGVSSVYLNEQNNYGSQFALDGLVQGKPGFWHSNTGDLNPWIAVRMTKAQDVIAVEVIDRLNCCFDRFKNVKVSVGYSNDIDSTDKQSCGIKSYDPFVASKLYTFVCPVGTRGQFIFIQKYSGAFNQKALHINEITVTVKDLSKSGTDCS